MSPLGISLLMIGGFMPGAGFPGQEACPPTGSAIAAFMLEILESPARATAMAEAGLPGFSAGEVRPLSGEPDIETCHGLQTWTASETRGVGPLRRWAFYQARDRYLIVSWLEPHTERIRLDRSAYMAVFDGDLELRIKFDH